ncbi:MAG: hypothetical protein ACE5JB_05565 [bacterium]
MPKEIIVAIISAFGGGLITIIVTFLNNKAKRNELEYNYKMKLKTRYLSNAQKHLEDVYIPLYSKLIAIQYAISDNLQKLKNEINELKKITKELGDKGLTAFLTTNVETALEHLIDFTSKSERSNKSRYGIITRYNISGNEISFYKILPEKYGPKMIYFYRKFKPIMNFFKHLFSIKYMTGLIDYSFEIVMDSAPLNSKEFELQLRKHLTDIKTKIKYITLGTK